MRITGARTISFPAVIVQSNEPRCASRNDGISSTVMPCAHSISPMKRRAISFGSTISTRFPSRPRSHSSRRGSACARSVSSVSVNVNALPLPMWLETAIEPFIASTSRATIASPRPVPPKRRECDESACVNG